MVECFDRERDGCQGAPHRSRVSVVSTCRRPILIVIDGAKALASGGALDLRPASRAAMPAPQGPATLNVTFPRRWRATVTKKMRAAYRDPDPLGTPK